MSGYIFECRERSNGVKCSTSISAGSKEELLKAALEHLFTVHGEKESLALKDKVRARMKKSRKVA